MEAFRIAQSFWWQAKKLKVADNQIKTSENDIFSRLYSYYIFASSQIGNWSQHINCEEADF